MWQTGLLDVNTGEQVEMNDGLKQALETRLGIKVRQEECKGIYLMDYPPEIETFIRQVDYLTFVFNQVEFEIETNIA